MLSTPLKNISQLGLLFPMNGEEQVPNHGPDDIGYIQYNMSHTHQPIPESLMIFVQLRLILIHQKP